MKDITLEIGGRDYRMACEPAEEAHLRKLAAMIDSRLANMPALANQSEQRMLLYAALLLADELHDVPARHAKPAAPQAVSAAALELLAERMEGIVARLEEPAASA